MKVYKDNEHCVTLHPFSWLKKRYLMVCVGLYVTLDPHEGVGKVRSEQEFWEEVPTVFANLGQAPCIDPCLPKPGGEVLVAGFCRSPHKLPVEAMQASFKVGKIARSFAVFGDREQLFAGGYSKPLPFSAMPLTWEKAFGGVNFASNPHGKGLNTDNKSDILAPNVEDPRKLLLHSSDMLEPVCPFPLGFDNPQRRALSGTYDEHWQKNISPDYPEDLNPEFFYSAQKAQRLYHADGRPAFFSGNENIEMHGMHHEHSSILGKLPAKRVRAFVQTTANFTPFDARKDSQKANEAAISDDDAETNALLLPYEKDYEAQGIFRECTLNCDTVWLFPDILGAFVMYRGMLQVKDDEMDDVLRVLVISEDSHAPTQSIEYYRDVLQKRIFPAPPMDTDSVQKHQAQLTKIVKSSLDLPKNLAKIRAAAKGQNPVMPFSLDDMAKSSQRTINENKKTLKLLEKQVAELKKELGHRINFNKLDLNPMRQALALQEQQLMQNSDRAKQALQAVDQRLVDTLGKSKHTLINMAKSQNLLNVVDLQAIEKAENMTSDKLLETPKSINPWHDAGFALLVHARRNLLDDEKALTILEECGLDTDSIQGAWLGLLHEPFTLTPSTFGLDPELAPQILPPGFVLPRFEGEKLIALTIYPVRQHELSTDKDSLVHVLGSDVTTPHFLAASQDDNIYLAVPCHLSAIFAEQEVGDFCHIIQTHEPSAVEIADTATLLILLPAPECEPQGKSIFESWKGTYAQTQALFLDKDCKHVLELAKHKKLLRPMVLEKLPQKLAEKHNIGLSFSHDGGIVPTPKLNLPFPTQQKIAALLSEHHAQMRVNTPNPRQVLKKSIEDMKSRVLEAMQKNNSPQNMVKSVSDNFDKMQQAQPKEGGGTALDAITRAKNRLAKAMTATKDMSSAAEPSVVDTLKKTQAHLDGISQRLAAMETMQQKNNHAQNISDKLQEDLKKQGIDPQSVRVLSREDVEQILATDRNFTAKNLSETDVSELDFSGAIFEKAICFKTNFQNCRLHKASFHSTTASYADFSNAHLQEADIKHSNFDFANFTGCDFSKASIEFTTFAEIQAASANFTQATLKMSMFQKANMSEANFSNSLLSFVNFQDTDAGNAHFNHVRAFKCIFFKCELTGTSFQNATLNECMLQNSQAEGVSFAGADLRKFYTENHSNLNNTNFQGADLREASLRMTYFENADFYQARLDNALFAQCHMQKVKIDGTQAASCRFRKCDLQEADLSYSNFMGGDVFKSRFNAAKLDGANMFAVNMDKIHIDANTTMMNTQLKKTVLDGQEDVLAYMRKKNP